MDFRIFGEGAGSGFQLRRIREELSIPPGHRIVGFVGRLDTQKGIGFLVRAMKLVTDRLPDVHLCVVGGGSLLEKAQQLCSNLGISSRTLFLGYRRDVNRLIQVFDAFVVPSIFEPFGNVLVEAAYQAKPIIASNVDGIPEVIANGEAGILIDCTEELDPDFIAPGSAPPVRVLDGKRKVFRAPRGPNIQHMADAISRCLSNEAYARSLGEKARSSVQSRFAIQRYASDLEGILEEADSCSDV